MAMLLVAVVQFVGLHMLNGVLSVYLNEQVHIEKEQIGHLFLYIGLVVGPFAIPMGRLADRIGKPQAVRLGLGICAVGMWLLPWVTAVPLLVITAGIFGVGFLLASPAWLALMTELAGEERRGGVVGIMNTGQGIGAALGAAFGGSLYDFIGPRAPFVASAILFTVSVLIVFRYVRDTPARGQVVTS
jgi:MFS family permease